MGVGKICSKNVGRSILLIESFLAALILCLMVRWQEQTIHVPKRFAVAVAKSRVGLSEKRSSGHMGRIWTFSDLKHTDKSATKTAKEGTDDKVLLL